MQNFWRDVRNLARRVKLRLQDGRNVAIAGRWLALCLLIAGVAAVGVWGSAGEPGGVNGLLEEAWQPVDVQPVAAEQNLGEKNATPQVVAVDEKKDGEQNDDEKSDVSDNPDVPDDEVIDGAPEPWVGDAVLQAEADLLALVPPLADWPGEPLRAFGFGYDESFGDYRFHNGADWQAAEGAPVLAALPGEVTGLPNDAVYGAGVEIRCGEKLVLLYRGLEPGDLQVGSAVAAGDVLGQVAVSPVFEDAYPPHLHLEIRLDGAPVDPAGYLPSVVE